MRTLSAKHFRDGEWVFHCPLHDEPFGFTTASTETQALNVLRGHVDDEHPGVKVRIKIDAGLYSTFATYTGTETVETGDLL